MGLHHLVVRLGLKAQMVLKVRSDQTDPVRLLVLTGQQVRLALMVLMVRDRPVDHSGLTVQMVPKDQKVHSVLMDRQRQTVQTVRLVQQVPLLPLRQSRLRDPKGHWVLMVH